MTEIARQLEVSLPAVSNWRRRHPSFPSANQVNGQELFMISEIANWLDGRKISKKNLKASELPGATYGVRFRTATGATSPSDHAIDDGLWKEFTRLRGTEDVAMFADLVLGLLYLAASNERRWNEILIADGARRLNVIELACLDQIQILGHVHRARHTFVSDLRGEARLTEIVQLIDRIRQSGTVTEAFDFLLNRFAAVEGRRGAAMHTPSTVVALLVELVSPKQCSDVLDPCCGSGEFLVGASKYLAKHCDYAADASYTGHALSERSASLAQMNASVHSISIKVDARADIIFQSEGSLIPERRFNVVLSNPPFDIKSLPGTTSAHLHGRYGSLSSNHRTNFAWLQYVASSLTDDGRAAVVMPGGTLFREGSERQIRARMIDDGIVEAIVALPPAMFTSTGIPVTTWLLNRSPRPRHDEILLIDASGLGHMIGRTQRSLSDKDRRRIADTVARWRMDDSYENMRGFSASVSVQKIHENDDVLVPARYVGATTPANTQPRSVRALRDELSRLARRAAEVDEAVDRKLDGTQAWIY